MVTPPNGALVQSSLHKIVQRIHDKAERPPINAITVDVLKLMELHLQRRGLIPASVGTSFRYLWFVAETERNVFLWRNGLSIEDASHFDFWVVVDNLVDKRIRQLENSDHDNPFTNPAWGDGCSNPKSADKEKQYLEMFLEIYRRSSEHAHALCHMNKMIIKELTKSSLEPVSVVLPRTPREGFEISENIRR